MINVEYKLNSIKAEGHTGNKGESLLCCAVSTLMWGLVNTLQHEGIEPNYEYKDGYQFVSYTGNKNVRRIFNAYANNLKSMSEEFPEDISFEVKN